MVQTSCLQINIEFSNVAVIKDEIYSYLQFMDFSGLTERDMIFEVF